MCMKRPNTPELREYLLQLVLEERSLEHLYRMSHNADELRAIRAEWKAAYRTIRESLVLEDSKIRVMTPSRQVPGPVRRLLWRLPLVTN
jgi:hypothetical protein